MKFFELKPEIAKVFAQEGFEFSGLFDFSFLYDNPNASPLQEDLKKYQEWLQNHWHAQMNFMEKNVDVRLDARKILENVRTAIVFLIPYATGERIRGSKLDDDNAIPPSEPENEFVRSVARYGRGRDYHKILKARGENAIDAFKKTWPQKFEARTVVDSVPFFERAHAKQAGLGFIGKNTMLIRPGVGSFFFIATILTTLTIEELSVQKDASHPLENLNCGTCRKCIEACPTAALKEYRLDANRCLSYLSIEHRDVISTEFLPYFKDIFFGCDICQSACPYNYSTTNALKISELTKTNRSFLFLTIEKIAKMNFSEYESWFGGTSLTRAKYAGLVRNALYAMWAQQSPNLEAVLDDRKNDPEPLLRAVVSQIKSL